MHPEKNQGMLSRTLIPNVRITYQALCAMMAVAKIFVNTVVTKLSTWLISNARAKLCPCGTLPPPSSIITMAALIPIVVDTDARGN